MSMQTVFFKEWEGNNNVQNFINGGTFSASRWTSGLGSAAPAVAYGDATVQSKVAAAKGLTVHQQGLGKGSNCNPFTLFSGYALGDGKSADQNGTKNQLISASPFRPTTMGYGGHFELGFGKPLIYAQYPYAEQCGGVYSIYGAQVQGRIMLPFNMSRDEVPIFVNAKQYNRIMRRRKKRAELELKNKMLKLRKPYLHLSRHLHAMRRPRGSGGRFLTKNAASSAEKTSTKSINAAEDLFSEPTESFKSEVLQFDTGIVDFSKGRNSGGSTSSGSEISSDPFESLHSGFQFYNGWGGLA